MSSGAENRPRARRWRCVSSGQFSTKYELPCRESERVAIVYAGGAPYSWATYGFPNENGKLHTQGESPTIAQAKADARQSLDDLLLDPPWLRRP